MLTQEEKEALDIEIAALMESEQQAVRNAAAMAFLLDEDVAFILDEEDATDTEPLMYPVLCLNVNDTFGFGCADAEPVPFRSLEKVADLYKRYGYHGIVAWVAKERNSWPIHCSCQHDGPKFIEACKELGYEKPE